jgi:hypothetical protein
LKNIKYMGLGPKWNSVDVYLPSMQEVLSLIPNTTKKERKEGREGRREEGRGRINGRKEGRKKKKKFQGKLK